MSFSALLQHKVWVVTQTVSSNAWGEVNENLGWDTSSQVNARVSMITNEKMRDAPGRYENIDYECMMKATESISYDNRIIYDNEWYNPRSIMRDSMAHHYTVLLEQIHPSG